MMHRGRVLAVIAACGLAAACGPKTPSGQVVATVGKHEITMRQLKAEMTGMKVSDPKQEKAAEGVALRNIVGRTILADAARKEGVEKSPDFALARDRAVDTMLAQTLEQQLIKAVPQATPEDGQKFIDANPDLFAQRKIFVLDQMRVARPNDANLVRQLGPLKTFDEIQALFAAQKIPYQRGLVQLDADTTDPKVVASILKLPPGELFILPLNPTTITINELKQTQVVPFTGPQAVALAQKMVTRERISQAVQKELQQRFAQGLKDVRFSKDFAYLAPKPGAAGAAGARPAATKPAPQ